MTLIGYKYVSPPSGKSNLTPDFYQLLEKSSTLESPCVRTEGVMAPGERREPFYSRPGTVEKERGGQWCPRPPFIFCHPYNLRKLNV